MKVSVVLGVRPEIIKFSLIIREAGCQKLDSVILHNGQHYRYNAGRKFFEHLELPEAWCNSVFDEISGE